MRGLVSSSFRLPIGTSVSTSSTRVMPRGMTSFSSRVNRIWMFSALWVGASLWCRTARFPRRHQALREQSISAKGGVRATSRSSLSSRRIAFQRAARFGREALARQYGGCRGRDHDRVKRAGGWREIPGVGPIVATAQWPR
jgi:hypothetical protein